MKPVVEMIHQSESVRNVVSFRTEEQQDGEREILCTTTHTQDVIKQELQLLHSEVLIKYLVT